MQRFLIEKNVASFFARLQSESDPEMRDVLRRLLIEEEDKFAYRSEKLEIVERYIDDCERRIHEFRQSENGRFLDPSVLEKSVENLERLAQILAEFRTHLHNRLDDGGL